MEMGKEGGGLKETESYGPLTSLLPQVRRGSVDWWGSQEWPAAGHWSPIPLPVGRQRECHP